MGGVRDQWTADGKRFMRELEDLTRLKVCIGYQASDGEHKAMKQDGKRRKKGKTSKKDKSISNLDVAMWNELGTSRSPSRPFMRNSIDNHTDVIRAAAGAQIKQLAAGASARAVLESMGAIQKGLMQREITEGRFVANASSTILRKKSDRPLVDTGQMRQSIHFVIKPKGDD